MSAPRTDLVGPVRTVTFGGGPRRPGARWWEPVHSVNYDVPADTMDPRYRTCIDHHVACDCREAEMAEEIHERAAALREVTEAAQRLLEGHPTWLYDEQGEELPGCQCTGCQIVRASHLYWTPTRAAGVER